MLDFVLGQSTTGSRRRWSALLLAAMLAALTMAIAAPAHAARYTAVAWGDNESGQLGDGTNAGPEQCAENKQACSTTPVAVSELSGVTEISAGYEHSLAL